MSQGEFIFTMQERTDKNGEKYLFGSLRLFNAVIFCRALPQIQGEPITYDCSVKPYIAKDNNRDDNEIWDEDLRRKG